MLTKDVLHKDPQRHDLYFSGATYKRTSKARSEPYRPACEATKWHGQWLDLAQLEKRIQDLAPWSGFFRQSKPPKERRFVQPSSLKCSAPRLGSPRDPRTILAARVAVLL